MDRDACAALDAADPLAAARSRFELPEGVVYLDGNSLGPLQRSAREAVGSAVGDGWGTGLIRSWNEAGWIGLAQRVAGRLSTLIGAAPREVAVADSTSVNLFKVLDVAMQLRPGRGVILTEERTFPTDVYVAEGLAAVRGGLEVRTLPRDELSGALDDDVAVLLLSHVDYRSGARHDAAALTAAAHDVGALAAWDLSHSTGAVAVDLASWGADLAVGCTYKFLNGGPGSPGYLYVADRHLGRVVSPLRGWFGHLDPFAFAPVYEPADGADRFLAGTPPILSLVALDAALAVWDEVGVEAATRKAAGLTDLFADLVDGRCTGAGVSLASPRDRDGRGAQVSLRHAEAYAVMQACIARGVIGDHRPPDLLRFGFSPLFLRYVDVWDAVEVLRVVLETGAWDQPEHRRRRRVI